MCQPQMEALSDSLSDWEALLELEEALTRWLLQASTTNDWEGGIWENWDWESEEIPAVSFSARGVL